MEENGDKVWVTVSSTVNLGNYENIKVDMGQSLTVTKEKADETRVKLYRALIEDLANFTEEIKPNYGRHFDNYFGQEGK